MAKEKKEEANLSPQQQKMKALQAALEKIEKSFGKGAIMKMGDENIEHIAASFSSSNIWNYAITAKIVTPIHYCN